ncbi:hypothetical protein [Pseudohongiella sp.]|uniref:Uncharacterized protein n=1 Tax=marine sediment metagenome TaxID=412755 RepID=A0A0F9W126_9ZZZZ|nr:hypothetical protein [Pseudohongiella sp.]HDZ09547.1 hypothetical protein [Pseudohongiella sp.]HEA62631.1 hypothetical protein [Pseudohongiella sp.]
MNKQAMHKWSGAVALAAALSLPAVTATAQNLTAEQLGEMRRSIDVFSGVMRESLGFNERRGVFSPRAGDVQGHYLAGQGIVLELTTPLQGFRSTTSMHSLNSALEELSSQLGNLMASGVVSRPDFEAMRDNMAMSLRSDEIAAFYREQMQQLSALFDMPAIEQALSAAAASAHNLRNMGAMDSASLEQMNQQLQDLRVQLAQRLSETEALRQEIRDRAMQVDALPSAEIQANWQRTREQLEVQVAALREQVAGQAQALRARNEALEAERLAQWQQDVAGLEDQVFVVLCDYASGLRALPADEHLTLMMTGLGSQAAEGRQPDRIHVFNKSDLLACQRGDLDPEDMRSRAVSYDF